MSTALFVGLYCVSRGLGYKESEADNKLLVGVFVFCVGLDIANVLLSLS